MHWLAQVFVSVTLLLVGLGLLLQIAVSKSRDNKPALKSPLAAKSFSLRNKSDHKAAQSYECKPAY